MRTDTPTLTCADAAEGKASTPKTNSKHPSRDSLRISSPRDSHKSRAEDLLPAGHRLSCCKSPKIINPSGPGKLLTIGCVEVRRKLIEEMLQSWGRHLRSFAPRWRVLRVGGQSAALPVNSSFSLQ